MAQPAEPMHILVVDDEGPARQRLVDLLKKDPQVGVVLEAANGRAAVEIIRREALDLVFLDVQMPELDGLQVIETVGAAAMPLTVFVTAYDQHAIRAFEANALDYLLKPFSDERGEAALARAKTRHDERSLRELDSIGFGVTPTARAWQCGGRGEALDKRGHGAVSSNKRLQHSDGSRQLLGVKNQQCPD